MDRHWKNQTSTGETILYSGRKDAQQQERVAIILKKRYREANARVKSVSSRLNKIKMRGKHVNMTILQYYSPTNGKKDEVRLILQTATGGSGNNPLARLASCLG